MRQNLNPADGIWSELKRGELDSIAVGSFGRLDQINRHGQQEIQNRLGLIEGCLAGTGLTLDQAAPPADIAK